MKALVYEGPETVNVRNDIALPPLKDGQARVRIHSCGVCGSDIGIFKGTHPRAKAPLVLGHEYFGVIEEICGESRGFSVGNRVAPYPLLSCGECFACKNGIPHVCKTLKIIGIDQDGGIAEYVNCSLDVLFKIDDAVSDIAAGCIEPLAVAVHTLHRSGFKTLDTAAIIGAGPVGILIGILLKKSGAARIIISDIDEKRLAVCKELGMETVNPREGVSLTDYVLDTTGGTGVDIVYECAGVESAAAEMTMPVRIDGTICLVGVHKKPSLVLLSDMHFRELHMVATRVYTKRAFGQAVQYARELVAELEKIAVPVLPLDESARVFDMIKNPDIVTIKPIIDCR